MSPRVEVTACFPRSWVILDFRPSADPAQSLRRALEELRVPFRGMQILSAGIDKLRGQSAGLQISVAGVWGRCVQEGASVRLMSAWASLGLMPGNLGDGPGLGELEELYNREPATPSCDGAHEPYAERFELPVGPALRVCSETQGESSESDRLHTVQYIIPVPNAGSIAILSCSTPEIVHKRQFDEIFDQLANQLKVCVV